MWDNRVELSSIERAKAFEKVASDCQISISRNHFDRLSQEMQMTYARYSPFKDGLARLKAEVINPQVHA